MERSQEGRALLVSLVIYKKRRNQGGRGGGGGIAKAGALPASTKSSGSFLIRMGVACLP